LKTALKSENTTTTNPQQIKLYCPKTYVKLPLERVPCGAPVVSCWQTVLYTVGGPI